MTRRVTRRGAMQTAAAGLGYFLTGTSLSAARVLGANEALRFACIGVGGKGSSDTDHAGELGDIVALCDIDDQRLGEQGREVPATPRLQRLPQAARRDGARRSTR